MKRGAHKRALIAVQNNLFAGSIQEITHKPNWGFRELRLKNICVGALIKELFFVNRIFHILLGEGVSWEDMKDCLLRAMKNTLRILILEHNPYSEDFNNVNYASYEALKKFLKIIPYPVTEINIDGRNTLFVITVLSNFDKSINVLNKTNLEFYEAVRYRNLPFENEEIYRVSSEKQNDSGYLINLKDRNLLRKNQYPLYSVVGGLMFLNAIAEIGKRNIILFDMSLKQLLYAKSIIYIIKHSETLIDFDNFLQFFIPSSQTNYLWGGLFNAVRIKPKEENEWFDVVRKGIWRMYYNEVRKILLENKIIYSLSSIEDINFPKDSIAYLSTIPKEKIKSCQSVYRFVVSPKNNIPILEMN